MSKRGRPKKPREKWPTSKKLKALEDLGVIEYDEKTGKPILLRIKLAEIIAEKLRIVHVHEHDDRTFLSYRDGVYREFNVEAYLRTILTDRFCNAFVMNEVLRHIRTTRDRPLSDFDSKESWTLNVKNGLLDLQTGKLRRHTPEYMSLTQLPWNYKKDEKCPEILKFLADVVPTEEDVERLLEVVAWTLMPGQPLKTFVILTGGGDNGKTTFLRHLLIHFLGTESVSNLTIQDLANQNRHFAKVRLIGKFANIAPDVSDDVIKDTGTVKSVSGGDYIDVEFKYGRGGSIAPRAKLIFAANVLPRAYDQTAAWFGRFEEIVLPYKFTGIPDPNNPQEKKAEPLHELLARMLTEDEMGGLLVEAVKRIPRLRKQATLSYSKTVEDKRVRYMTESDMIYAYVAHALEPAWDGTLPSSNVWDGFLVFCKIRNRPPGVGHIKFYDRLANYIPFDNVFAGEKGSKYRALKGVKWKCVGCPECVEKRPSTPQDERTPEQKKQDDDKKMLQYYDKKKELDALKRELDAEKSPQVYKEDDEHGEDDVDDGVRTTSSPRFTKINFYRPRVRSKQTPSSTSSSSSSLSSPTTPVTVPQDKSRPAAEAKPWHHKAPNGETCTSSQMAKSEDGPVTCGACGAEVAL